MSRNSVAWAFTLTPAYASVLEAWQFLRKIVYGRVKVSPGVKREAAKVLSRMPDVYLWHAYFCCSNSNCPRYIKEQRRYAGATMKLRKVREK